jgi:hypothetical protein
MAMNFRLAARQREAGIVFFAGKAEEIISEEGL